MSWFKRKSSKAIVDEETLENEVDLLEHQSSSSETPVTNEPTSNNIMNATLKASSSDTLSTDGRRGSVVLDDDDFNPRGGQPPKGSSTVSFGNLFASPSVSQQSSRLTFNVPPTPALEDDDFNPRGTSTMATRESRSFSVTSDDINPFLATADRVRSPSNLNPFEDLEAPHNNKPSTNAPQQLPLQQPATGFPRVGSLSSELFNPFADVGVPAPVSPVKDPQLRSNPFGGKQPSLKSHPAPVQVPPQEIDSSESDAEIKKLKATIKSLESKISARESSERDLQNRVLSLESANVNLESMNLRLEKQLTTMEEGILNSGASSQEVVTTYEKQIKFLKAEVASLKTANETMASSLETELTRSNFQLKETKDSLVDVEARLRDAELENATLRARLEKSEKAEEELNLTHSTIEALEQEIRVLKENAAFAPQESSDKPVPTVTKSSSVKNLISMHVAHVETRSPMVTPKFQTHAPPPLREVAEARFEAPQPPPTHHHHHQNQPKATDQDSFPVSFPSTRPLSLESKTALFEPKQMATPSSDVSSSTSPQKKINIPDMFLGNRTPATPPTSTTTSYPRTTTPAANNDVFSTNSVFTPTTATDESFPTTFETVKSPFESSRSTFVSNSPPKPVTTMPLKDETDVKKDEEFGGFDRGRSMSMPSSIKKAAQLRNTAKSDKCAVCEKVVYMMDKLEADGVLYHKGCFRCSQCNKAVGVGSYAAVAGKVFCKPHFKQLFKMKGNYDEGFGGTQHKKKWLSKGENEDSEA